MPSIIKLVPALLLLSSPLASLNIVYAADSISSVTLSSPQMGDLHATELSYNELPAVNTRRQYVSYVSKATSNDLYQPAMSQTSQSDQYWKSVTGAELNKGVPFSVSQPNSVIRIAPRHESLTSLTTNNSISPDDITITPYSTALHSTIISSHTNPVALIHSKVDADALATAGLTDRSSALTLSDKAKPGLYTLKIGKWLPSDGRYLINVKEKNSPFQLTLNAPITIANNVDSIRFNLDLSNSQVNLVPQVFLKNNQGQQTPLKAVKYLDHWQALLPKNMALSTHNTGLSEIIVNVNTQVDGLPITRTVKTAFKAFVNSAKIDEVISLVSQDKQLQSIILNIEVANEGRYEVSAVLTGTNKQGQHVAILKTQAASWITPERSQLKLMLDPTLIKASGLKAPFALTQLELKDQGQMARLSYQAQALVFK